MDQPPTPRQKARENMLIVALFVLGGGIGLMWLDFITLGIVAHFLLISGGIAVVGAFHYLVWGHALSKEVEPEREALRLKELESPQWTQAPADAIQDLTRTQGIQRK